MTISRADLEDAYLEACALDVEAFKPGNVSVYASGHDMTPEDFYRSARISALPICDSTLSLGEKVYRAVEATREAVGCNTNLGIVLLAAPLIEAVQSLSEGGLRERLRAVIAATSRTDADWVYRAIRLAEPGGLGKVGREDVHCPPSVTLLEAMELAKDYDRIAFNYTFAYRDIYELAIPGYHDAVYRWGSERLATVAVFAALLRRIPDSHVERKFGRRYTGIITTRMAYLERKLSQSADPERVLAEIGKIDEEFKAAGINPGTTADLMVATLLAVRLEKLTSLSRSRMVGAGGNWVP
ncbi:triphosphoribosyl-dephospho-CoA synthase [Methylohalobius crimeensis]|uniref:triphosphoribosyl-dephospho-CoA synthase n=1 Tax=Methylohalobius crimeensis TaxID=244365 RepID=UPI0003B52071|nr:triphosphoribosyl-dephospho-CoA synthase [Methylohalobius crimeensis]